MAQKIEFVALLGMERYSSTFFRRVAAEVRQAVPDFQLTIFEDHDTISRPEEVEAAIERCSCLLLVLITMNDYAEWLVPRVQKYDPPVVFSFESMPEVMGLTRVGSYNLRNSKGMPRSVQNVARLLVGGREEDVLYGYLKVQKLTRKVLNMLPGKTLGDFRNWTNVSSYWLHRSVENYAAMFKLILKEYMGYNQLHVPGVVEIPTMGFAHPDAPHFFARPEEYERWERKRKKNRSRKKAKGTVAVLSFRVHLLSGMEYHYDIVRVLEEHGLRVLPIFVMGVEAHIVVREWLEKMGVDVIVNTMGFPLVGGPVGSSKPGLTTETARELLSKLNVPYIVAQPMYLQSVDDWCERGVGPVQSTVLYSLPEMDGAIDPVVLGGLHGEGVVTLPDRLRRLTRLTEGLITLRRKFNSEKKIAIIVYNYPPGMGNTATAALLDVPASLVRLLRRLREAGYHVGDFPEDPVTLVRCITGSNERDYTSNLPPGHPAIPPPVTVARQEYYQWVHPHNRQRIEARWGNFPGDIAPVGNEQVFLGGMHLGNIYIGVQPPIGMPGDPMRLLFERENAPHHQYMLFYRWLAEGFEADAMIHVGMHGSAEWMPGLHLGVTENCWPDALLGEVPNFYLYPLNNPAEANIAKRRGYSTIISHAIPPYGRAGLYKELAALKEVLEEYRAAPRESTAVEEVIQQKIAVLHLDTELVRQHDEPFDAFVSRVYVYLRTLEQRLIVDRLHILGEVQSPDQLRTLLTERLKVAHETMPSLAELVLDTVQTRQAAKNDHQHTTGKTSTRADDGPIRNGQHHPANGRLPAEDTHLHTYQEVLKAVRMGNADALRVRDALDAACITFVQHAVLDQEPVEQAWKQAITEYCRSGSFSPPASSFTHQVSPDRMLVLQSLTDYARKMLAALQQNTQEIEFLLKGLRGEYIPAVHGGDLLRDGLSVLPTGRNIHSLDPFRIPSDAAFARGTRIAESLIQAHQAAHNNAYPETIAQVLWGIDTIKTKGEAIGTILSLIGAKRIKDGLGKIERYELLPLDEVGHPRIDVLITASGVFRDTFAGTMDMLDRLIREAAAADEPEEQNFIRKHVQELVRQGISFEDATARMFTQAAGTYGTEVEGLVEGGTWEQREELEDMFVKRNMYAYGGTKGGTAHAEVLQSLLGTVQHVAQEIDSVEYGLTDIPYYYSYSGALRAAAERRSGQQVDLSYIESFTAETKVQELDQALRVEYRTKLLNPAWYESMLRHGYNGAVEITNRFTYMLGWSATTGAVDNWVYDESAATFILDDAMRQRLEAANPEGLRNAVSRLLEASDRDLWQTNEETLERLRALHADLEDRLEGVI